jgi:hypothetical protein
MAKDMANNGFVVIAAITRDVIAGLDPAIHHFGKRFFEDRWIRGASPVKTALRAFCPRMTARENRENHRP